MLTELQAVQAHLDVGSSSMSKLAVVRFTVIQIAIAGNALIGSVFMEPPVSLNVWYSVRIGTQGPHNHNENGDPFMAM